MGLFVFVFKDGPGDRPALCVRADELERAVSLLAEVPGYNNSPAYYKSAIEDGDIVVICPVEINSRPAGVT